MTTPAELPPIPGREVVGRGVYLRPDQPFELKDILFEQKDSQPYYATETASTYAVPAGYEVNPSPPMPANQALNKTILEESWERFEKRTKLDASLAIGRGPVSIDVNWSDTKELRQEEDSYYAMRSSFLPLWSIYLPNTTSLRAGDLDADVPVPFSHKYRQEYENVFQRYGTHYVRSAWVGGKASLVFTVRKSTQMTKEEIQAGLKASLTGLGKASLDVGNDQSRERLQSNSQCTVFGKGGDEAKLAVLSNLDEAQYNAWLSTVKDNPQVIEFEAMGIWTLVADRKKAQALMDAYREEIVFTPLRVVFKLGDTIHVFGDVYYYTYDVLTLETTKPARILDRWPDLLKVGFERVDAAFLAKYLVSPENEDLNRKIFFFNRDKYVRWDVDTHAIDPGYPRLIAEGWPGVTFERIDAVANVAPDALYFFKGNEYIRFNTLIHHADEGYSDLISRRWVGLPFDRLDAAVYWGNGQVYFFRDNQYIRYDTVLWRADPGYPKSIASNYVEDWRFLA